MVGSLLGRFQYATGVFLGPPEFAIIETTNRCNLNCIMCYRRENLKETGDMDFDLFKQIARAVKGARQVHCQGGGEPLLHPQIADMIDYAYEICRPEVLAITTNGTVLNREMAGRLQASQLTRLVVSVDGSDKETYEEIRGFCFEQVVENVRYFKSISRVPTVIQFTAMKQNVASLPGLPKLASYMGAESINVQHLLSWNAEIAGMRIFDVYEEFESIRERTMGEARRYGIECAIPPIPGGYPPGYLNRCDLPFRQVYINFKGEIAPCCVAVHLSLERSFRRLNGRNIRNWRRRVVVGDFFPECRRFCYVR